MNPTARNAVSAVSAFLVFLAALSVPAHAASTPPAIGARCALLFDANSGRVLFKKNENEVMPVASTQKLLTALIIAEEGNLDKIVKITEADTNCEPTKLYLKPGETYTRRELLAALLVKSPNDVARALARDNAGSLSAFCDKMDARMQRLGGSSSNFENPNGLPAKGQHSTARDMARVARAAYFNPVLRDIMATKYLTFRYDSGKTTTLKNTNRVLRTFSFCNGMKTGYTVASGHCLISSGTHGNRDVIAVVFGSNKANVWPESAALLAYGLGLSPAQVEALRISQQ